MVYRGAKKLLCFVLSGFAAKKKEIMIAPDIVIYELANLFRYKKNFTEKEIFLILEALEEFRIEIIHFGFKDMAKAAILARQRNITFTTLLIYSRR